MARRRVGQRHTNKVYFRDPELDFYLQAFPLGYATYGGARAGEALFAASQVHEKDPETWVSAWSDMAARVADSAQRSEAADAHCQAVNLRLAHAEVFAFFDRSLAGTPRTTARPPALNVPA